MKSPIAYLALMVSAALFSQACAGEPSSGADGGSGGVTGTGGSTAGTGGGGGGVGGGGNGGGNGGGGGGGATGSGGSTGTGGSGGSGTGGSGGGGSGGSGGAPAPMKGASARAVCQPNATYGNPLQGMGAVMMAMTPNSAPVYGFAFIEGPVWVGSLGTLFFSDNAASPAERILKLVPPSTLPASFLEMSGSNGLAIDNDDKLIVANQRNRTITRVDPMTAAVLTTIVPAGNFKPNDLIVRSDGTIYFTDPATGFYRVPPGGGAVSAPITRVQAPNGIVLSPDEKTLYVGDVNNRTIYKLTVGDDGAVNEASFTMFTRTTGNTVDGMAVDCAGNIYAGTQTGVEVFSPTATALGTVPTGESSNCTFGDADRRTLYVTSRSVLKYVKLAVPGLPD
jgi:gluconolactonase